MLTPCVRCGEENSTERTHCRACGKALKPDHDDLGVHEPPTSVAPVPPKISDTQGFDWQFLLRAVVGALSGGFLGNALAATTGGQWGALIGFFAGGVAPVHYTGRGFTIDRAEVARLAKEGSDSIRFLTGYRANYELAHYWWHRLWQVSLISTACVVFVIVFDNHGCPPYFGFCGLLEGWIPEGAAMSALFITVIYIVVAANIYYRGVVYVIKGPRL